MLDLDLQNSALFFEFDSFILLSALQIFIG